MGDSSRRSIFIKIAKTFSGMREHDLAVRTCERGLELFPREASLYALKGRIQVSEFNRSKSKDEILSALSSFEKSLSIEPENYIAAMLSAKIYIKGRAFKKAREKLEMVFAVTPGDPKAVDLMGVIENREGNSAGEAAAAAREEEGDEEGDGLDDTRDESLPVNSDLLVSSLELFRGVRDVELALLVDRYGMVFKSISFGSQKHDIPRYGITVSNILRSSKSAAANTSLGNFQRGVLMTPRFFINIVAVSGVILAVLADSEADQALIDKKINRYLRETGVEK